LISASIELAVIISQCGARDQSQLLEYGALLGLAFQIQDDILDIESSSILLGAQQGGDMMADKLTYPSVVGLVQAKEKVERLYAKALSCIEKLSFPGSLLIELSRFMLSRQS
jgi:farnesyl diphosphate synthase